MLNTQPYAEKSIVSFGNGNKLSCYLPA